MALNYYPYREESASGRDPVWFTITDAKAIGVGKQKGPFIELRIGQGKAGRIAWLTPEAARRVGCGLIVAAAEAEEIKERESQT